MSFHMNRIKLQLNKRCLFIGSLLCILVLGSLFPVTLFAETMDNALSRAVYILKQKGLSEKEDFELVLKIVNYDSKKLDREARVIQGATFSALQSGFPSARIILESEAIAGISSRAVMLKGTYQQKSGIVYVTLQAINQNSGQLIAKADVEYDSEMQIAGDMVAVLNIQAANLSKSQNRIFSKIFRSELTKTRKMNLIASEYVDAADADKIQEEYQCSRDECGTIIAQQLNASQVITPIYEQVTENLCYLTASWKDIATGRTINEVSIKHDCQLETLDGAIGELACKLVGTCGQQVLITPIEVPEPEPMPEPEPEPEPELMPEPEPEPVSPSPESDEGKFSLLTIGIPLSYSPSSVNVSDSEGTSQDYEVETDGGPSGYYLHWGFGYSERAYWGLSWTTISQPIKSTTNTEVYVNALDFDWTGLIGGVFALGFGGGFNWSNIICDTCFWEPEMGVQFMGRFGFVGDGFGILYSFHAYTAQAKESFDDQYGTTHTVTASWGATASILSFAIKF
jgi:hypothetical protein